MTTYRTKAEDAYFKNENDRSHNNRIFRYIITSLVGALLITIGVLIATGAIQ